MREQNPFEPPRSEPEIPEALNERLHNLIRNWERKSFERVDIPRLLREGKIDEFQREFQEAKLCDLAHWIGVEIATLNLKTRKTIVKKKGAILGKVREMRRRIQPFWANEAKTIILINHLALDLDLDFTSDQVLEDAWNFVMGSI